ncbi:hypothetical protein SDRG_11179 [Saprolegnia diclina VS20]|uniref:Uncharacterized protein n=1 Tax=Saprolegnia diclina (strain VS20) TaxID=1156394 RepID=T0Q8P4_SAPDV|nr:hypothetical protein SDRG_11179 [Saprolegnia diclina VS20]EQC30991.1 hypothetical protein SDRG_11179 [Saprolegnia diclina VS20]|eukprot:XP_008615430.1 hypothetical protein SDRG_11179 [Saprolegnia diclina VS20]
MLSCISTPSSTKYEVASKLFEDGVSTLSFQDAQRSDVSAQRVRIQDARRSLCHDQIATLRGRRDRLAAALAAMDARIDARVAKIALVEQELTLS